MVREAIYIGLTGGIGSGKSTVAGILCQLTAKVIDADAISKLITGANGQAIPHIEAVFGTSLINSSRMLDRDQMREIIFHDPTAKSKLEGILHPIIQQEMLRAAIAAESAGATCVVFDIPLLIESKMWRKFTDWVIVIDCSVQTQSARVITRNGLSAEMVQRVIASQASRSERLQGADIVLFNEDISLAQLEAQVREIAPKIGL